MPTILNRTKVPACPVCGKPVEHSSIEYGYAATVNGGWPVGGTVIGAGDLHGIPGRIDKVDPFPALNRWSFEPCGHVVEAESVEVNVYEGPDLCWARQESRGQEYRCEQEPGHDGWHSADRLGSVLRWT